MAPWHEIDQLFRAAVERPAALRAAFLDRACAGDVALRREVESLLAADDGSDGTLEAAVEAEAASLGAERAASWTGRRLGPYRICRELGHGGMGVVYLADRVDGQFRQQVTIKVVRPGLDTEGFRRRFRNERQILASLHHPHIARLLDGGTTGGLPYYVMEHIEGEPIDRYCDRHRLTVEDRLDLFAEVCVAVHYAHQNLVVHRDIKPGNVLVTADGTPHLLDFGIAKLLDPEAAPFTVEATASEVRPMTPRYASPEQVRGGPITTATDVYSLGVLLYELLTGRAPYRLRSALPMDLERAICGTEPEKPSTAVLRIEETEDGAPLTLQVVSRLRGARPESLRRRLAGDLDNIVLMAMRKEPERRYVSAQQLADDVRRHLRALPVIARPDTFGYRAGKFVRRHRLGVAFAALLVVFAVGMTVQSVRVARQRDAVVAGRERAEAERRASEQVSAFLVDLFQVADPSTARGETVTAREILDRGAEAIARKLGDQPEIQARLMNTMGAAYLGLGLFDAAEPLIDGALAARQALAAADSRAERLLDVAESLQAQGALLFARGDHDAAAEHFRTALQMRRRLGADGALVAESQHLLAMALFNIGDPEAAERLLREALATRLRLLGPEHPGVAETRTRLAEALVGRGDAEGAEEELDKVLRSGPPGDHPALAKALENLGQLLLDGRGDVQRAQEVRRAALEMRLRLFGPDHHAVAESHNGLGLVQLARGQYPTAEASFREAMRIMRRERGDEHWLVALTMHNVARALHYQRDDEAAKLLYRRALPLFVQTFGDRHDFVAMCQINLAASLIETGDLVEAETLARQALELYRQALPAHDWRISRAESTLGACLAGSGRYQQAEPLLENAYRILKEKQSERSLSAQEALRRLVALYQAWGKPEKAAGYLALLESER